MHASEVTPSVSIHHRTLTSRIPLSAAGNTIQDDRSHTLQPMVHPEPPSDWQYSTVWDAASDTLSLLFTFHDPGSYSITMKMAYEDFAPAACTVVAGEFSAPASQVAGAGTRFGEENAWSSLRIVPRDGSALANALPPGRLDASKISLLATPAVAATTAGGAVVRIPSVFVLVPQAFLNAAITKVCANSSWAAQALWFHSAYVVFCCVGK